MSVSDFVSPLFGPVIRLLSGLVVNSIVDPNDDKEGEWVGLHNANLLLGKSELVSLGKAQLTSPQTHALVKRRART